MNQTLRRTVFIVLMIILTAACMSKDAAFTGEEGEVKLIVLDPGHFHAGLVQKTMYGQVDRVVQVYAPDGPDVDNYLQQVEGYNNRVSNPTQWEERRYIGPEYLEAMIAAGPGNVMITAGNNGKKTGYIRTAVEAGLNVLSDKPMCIDPEGFALLKEIFESAEERGLLLYDIMTERSEITTVLQKELSRMPPVFGQMEIGSEEHPAVTKESVHHFFKYVSGNPIRRPGWFFDVSQQGEGLVDVTTHLVDLVQWACFPGQVLDYRRDIDLLSAWRWPTIISPQQYEKVTGLSAFPSFLAKDTGDDGALRVYANGEINYRIRGIHAKVSVVWNYQAPAGGGDTHYSIMRGSRANLVIRQGAEEQYVPQLYVEPVVGGGREFDDTLQQAIDKLAAARPGLSLTRAENGWQIVIPDEYRVGHEAHFAQVMERYLQYLVDGELPDWEAPNMLAKYYTTTTALQRAKTRE